MYILSDNSTEFMNSLMDQVLKQLGIERIFSAPYHPQSNRKLEVFHKYLKPTLKKLCTKDQDSGMLNLEAHRLALAIAKKTLDENHFRTVQKTTGRQPPSFQIGDCAYFKKKQPSKWDLKWRPGYRIVQIEHDGHFLHIENHGNWKKYNLAM